MPKITVITRKVSWKIPWRSSALLAILVKPSLVCLSQWCFLSLSHLCLFRLVTLLGITLQGAIFSIPRPLAQFLLSFCLCTPLELPIYAPCFLSGVPSLKYLSHVTQPVSLRTCYLFAAILLSPMLPPEPPSANPALAARVFCCVCRLNTCVASFPPQTSAVFYLIFLSR